MSTSASNVIGRDPVGFAWARIAACAEQSVATLPLDGRSRDEIAALADAARDAAGDTTEFAAVAGAGCRPALVAYDGGVSTDLDDADDAFWRDLVALCRRYRHRDLALVGELTLDALERLIPVSYRPGLQGEASS